jgi:hypothetical protein
MRGQWKGRGMRRDERAVDGKGDEKGWEGSGREGG